MTDEMNPPAAETPPAEGTRLAADQDSVDDRINRLSGEAAPDLSPEEFARLQRGGALNIDARGRVRVNRRGEEDPGVSLRKRRAWYG